MKKAAIFAWPVLALALVSYSTSSFALGTAEEREACTPDVFKLCSSEIPNVDKIIACMKKKKSQLSPKCKAVFNAPAEKTTTASKTRSLGCGLRRLVRFQRRGGATVTAELDQVVRQLGPLEVSYARTG